LSGYYSDSPVKLIMSVYPQHDWKPWKFVNAPGSFWKDVRNQVAAVLDVLETRGVLLPILLYDLRFSDLGRKIFLSRYECVATCILTLFPQFLWDIGRFRTIPSFFWSDLAQRRNFLSFVFGESVKGFTREEVHRTQKMDLLCRELGYRDINQYSKMLQTRQYLPHASNDKRFEYFFSQPSIHRKYFGTRFATMTNIPLDFTNLNTAALEQFMRISRLGSIYPTFFDFFSTIHPEFSWQIFQFQPLRYSFWDSQENRIHFYQWISALLDITDINGWYNVTQDNIIEYGGETLIERFGSSFPQDLNSAYPSINWQFWRFSCHTIQTLMKKNYESKKRQFILWLGKELTYQIPQDFYELRLFDISDTVSTEMRKAMVEDTPFSFNPLHFIQPIMPEILFFDWGVLKRLEMRKDELYEQMKRQIIMEVEDKLRISKREEWYRLRREEFRYLRVLRGVWEENFHSQGNTLASYFFKNDKILQVRDLGPLMQQTMRKAIVHLLPNLSFWSSRSATNC